MATAFTALRVASPLNHCSMKHDLIQLAEQYPGLTISVSLDDLLKAGRTLCSEIFDYISDTRVESSPAAQPAEELLTQWEVMDKLGVSRSTLWRWSQIGYLTPVKVGVSVRYKTSEVEALASNKGGAL